MKDEEWDFKEEKNQEYNGERNDSNDEENDEEKNLEGDEENEEEPEQIILEPLDSHQGRRTLLQIKRWSLLIDLTG